mgnify:CR=1 FL=1
MIGKFFKGLLIFIISAAVLIAVLRVFGWDPFGVVSWIWDATLYTITRLADTITPGAHQLFGR